MTTSGAEGRGTGPAIVVDDARVPATGWVSVGLDPRLATTTRPPVAGLAPLTGTVSGRVPDHAFVHIGWTVAAQGAAGQATANDNARPRTTSGRSVWRDIFFLTLLAVTIVGAFWSGKLNATQRVIVVPGPSSFHSIVT